MTDATLSEALKEAYASAPTDEVIYHTLEIFHPDFSVPIRVVRDYDNLTATLESTAPRNASTAVEFIAFAFDVVPPETLSSQMPTCVVEIDNVSRDILSQIEAASSSPEMVTVIYRQFLSGDLSGPENDPPLTLTALSISATVFRIRMTCGFGDLVNRKFPADIFTTEQFPGLIAS